MTETTTRPAPTTQSDADRPPRSLTEALDRIASASPDVTASFPSESEDLTYRQLHDGSVRLAETLTAQGVRPGDRVGIFCPNAPEFLVAFFAALRAGAAACPLPLPMGMRGSDVFLDRLGRIAAAAQLRTVVVSHRFAAFRDVLAAALPGVALVSTTPATTGTDGEADPNPAARSTNALPTPDDLAVVQFTSGSTALPKGVRLTHHNVLACLDAIRHGINLGPADSGGFWLPLFHDMGLFGTLAAVLTGVPAVVWSPADFVKRPDRWLRDFAEHGTTITAMPAFGYEHLVASVPAAEVPTLDLSRWRVAFNGAEPITARSVHTFTEHFAPAGFRPETMFPVYGMAEATLPVTFPPSGRPPVFEWIDREALTARALALPVPPTFPRARAVAAVGRPVLGMRLRVVDPVTETFCQDGEVGEIQIRGASVTSGYLRASDDTSASDATSESLPARHSGDEFTADGWLRTGDLGYLRRGELFVTGRSKEMITVRGANHYPQDVEAVARDVPGVSRGRCVAVADRDDIGRERVLLIAETSADGDAAAALTVALRRRIREALGLDAVAVHLVPPRSIPRTSSGKYQRLAARDLLRTP